MKYLFNIIATVFFGWPALVAAYVFSALASGWETGRFLYDRHEQAAIDKFINKWPKD